MKSSFILLFMSLNSVFALEFLENLDYSNQKLAKLRNEVKVNLVASRSGKNEFLLPLAFYKYKVKKGDHFFKIMAKTGMDIDTLSSVNELSSPQDIFPGKVLQIPNMRGVYDRNFDIKDPRIKENLAKKYGVPTSSILFDSVKKLYFLPGQTLQKTEKSYFYGFAFLNPLPNGRKSSDFGFRQDPFTHKKTFHGGLDIAAPKGTKVSSAQDGEIIYAGKAGNYGKLIIVRHILGYETWYGHLSEISLKKGDRVKKGEKIGEVGMTGRATGNHLHFEVRRNSKRQKAVFRHST